MAWHRRIYLSWNLVAFPVSVSSFSPRKFKEKPVSPRSQETRDAPRCFQGCGAWIWPLGKLWLRAVLAWCSTEETQRELSEQSPSQPSAQVATAVVDMAQICSGHVCLLSNNPNCQHPWIQHRRRSDSSPACPNGRAGAVRIRRGSSRNTETEGTVLLSPSCVAGNSS